MSASLLDTLQTLTARGVRLVPIGEALEVHAPQGVLSPSAWEWLRAEKPRILALLDWRRELSVDPVGPLPQGRCTTCRSPSWWWDAKAPAWRCPWCESPGDRLVACYTLGLPLLGLCPWCGAPRQENPAWDLCDGDGFCGEPICPACLLCSPTCPVLVGCSP